jgi:hypothetical protein
MRVTSSLSAIRRRLLADPSLIDVRGAAIRLLAKRDRCSRSAAEQSFAELSDNVAVDRVFKLVLPDEYRRQKGSLAERRSNFFRIVGGLFPVDWDYLDSVYMEDCDDEDDEPGRCSFFDYGIVIESMRPFNGWSLTHYWDKLPLAYQLADVLFMDTPASW